MPLVDCCTANLFPCCAISREYSSPLEGLLPQASLRELGVQETRERGGGEGGGWRVEVERYELNGPRPTSFSACTRSLWVRQC